MTRVRKRTCGAGALLGVLLLAAFAGAALTLHYEARGLARGEALDRAAGRIFAAWFRAAHRASQEHAAAFETTLAGGHTIVLTPTRLRALGTAPPGMPDAPGRNATFFLGVIADGTTRGVPMAFGVLEPAPDGGAAHGVAIREGALGSGLAGLESVGSSALMAPHLPAIEAALGRSLGRDAFYLTADHGLRYLEQALYRRAQPGRAYLNRLETGLDMSSADPVNPAGQNIARAGAVMARAADLSGTAEIGGNALADDSVMAGRLATADLSARELGGAVLTVSADLIVGHAVTGVVSAASVKVAERLDAGGLSTAGTLSARTLSAATAVAVAGEAAVTRTGARRPARRGARGQGPALAHQPSRGAERLRRPPAGADGQQSRRKDPQRASDRKTPVVRLRQRDRRPVHGHDVLGGGHPRVKRHRCPALA